MVDCNIHNVSSEAFKGLESYLHTLDVSSNNLTEFPVWKLQQNFNMLFKLGLRDNKIKDLFPVREPVQQTIIKDGDKKKAKGKNVDKSRTIFRNDNDLYEFYSLQDFDFSGWNNSPLRMTTINGYVQQCNRI